MKLNSTFLKAVFFIAFIVTFFSACKKDDPDPDYVGTWVITGSVDQEGTSLQMKDVLTLTQGSYTEIIQLKNPANNTYVDYIGFKGDMAVSGQKFDITIKQAGFSAINPVSGAPTGQITYYNSSTTEFTQIMESFEMQSTLHSEYSVSGKELTLKTDLNSDADFSDDGEVTVFTRQ